MTRSGKVILNASSNYLRFGVNVVVMLVMTPVLIRRLGEVQFGIWSLVFSVLGFAMLLDFGMDTSVVKWVGHCRGRQEPRYRNRILSTVAAAYLGLALLGTLAVLLLSVRFSRLFGIPSGEAGTATAVLLILAGRTILFGLPLSLFRAVLFGEQRIWQINVVQAAANVAYGAVAVAGLSRGLGLVGLAWLNLASLALEHAAYVVLVVRGMPDLRLSWRLVDRGSLRDVLSFSAYQFVINVSGVVLLKLDPILVSVFLPLSAVAIYAVALKVAENLHLLTKQSINVLAPLVAQLHGEGQQDHLRLVLINATKFVFAGAAIVVAASAPVAGAAMRLWVGPALAGAGLVFTILSTALALSIPQITGSTVLAMTGHHRLIARAAVLRVIVNIVVSIALVRPMGLAGVAAGTLVATLAIDWGLVLPAMCRIHGIQLRDYARRVLRPVAFPVGASLLVSLGVGLAGEPGTLSAVLLRVAAAAGAGAALFLLTGLEPGEKRFCSRRLERRPLRRASGRAVPVAVRAGAAPEVEA